MIKDNAECSRVWFFIILSYLIVDYARPQAILPIGFIKPGMIVTLALSWYLVSSGKLSLSDSKQTRLIWSFIALTAVYVPFARNNFFAYTTTKSMLLIMPFILSIIIVVDSIDRLRMLLWFQIIIMSYVSLYSLFHGGKGQGGSLADENDLSLYINTILPFCYFLFFYERNKLRKIVYAFSVIVGILAIMVSFSRGGFVGLVCMATVAWWFSPKKLVSLVLVCLLGGMIYYYGGESYREEMHTVVDRQDGTARCRILSWQAAREMFLDNPWGVGGNNFQVRFPEYQSSEFTRGMWGRVAHSLWFTLIAELGIIGIFLYFSLIYYNIKDILFLKNQTSNKDDKDLRYLYYLSLAFLASLTGFFASGTFLSVLYYPHYWYITAMIVASDKIGKRKLEIDKLNDAVDI